MILKVCGSITSTVFRPLLGTYTRGGKLLTVGLRLPGRSAAYTSRGSSRDGMPGSGASDCVPAVDVPTIGESNRAARMRNLKAYLTLAFAFRRSAQYFFMRVETALRASADISVVRLAALVTACRTARR